MRTARLDRDAGHPKTTKVDVQQGVDIRDPVVQISAQTKAVLELVQGTDGDDFGKLVDLYMDANSFMDEGIKLAIEAKMKEKLAELKLKVDGGEKIGEFYATYHGALELRCGSGASVSKLLRLEQDPINSDGCITDILYSACRDLDTAMFLWERFTSYYDRRDASPKSNEFLRKHLETYGGDERKLWDLHEKFNHGSRRARFVTKYIGEMRHDAKLKRLEQAKGDYDSLAQLGSEGIGEEFCAAMDEILPTMIEECGGDFWKLADLYKRQYCSRPLVEEAVKTALLPEVAKCGDDFDRLAELRSKTPDSLHDVIDQAVVDMCHKDSAKFLALVKSPLAKFLCKFVIFNLDILEAVEPVDIDTIKSLLGLAEQRGVKNDGIAMTFLDMRVKGLMAKFIAIHGGDFEGLMGLYDATNDDEYKKIVDQAVKEAIPVAVNRCAGDFVKLVDLYEKMSEKVCNGVTQIFIDAFESSSQSLVVYCDHDIEKLRAVRKPAQEVSYSLEKAIEGAVKEAMKLIIQLAVSQCGDSLEKLSELYEKYEKDNNEDNREESYKWRKQEATNEVFGVAIERLIPSLLVECEGDLAKLGVLYGKLPTHFKCYGSAGKIIVEAARKIVESLVDGCPDDLDELAALYDGIPYQFRSEMELNFKTRVKNLLPLAVAQCNGNVDELGKLRGEKLRYSFKAEFDEAVKDSLQIFVSGCGGDFGKHVALYNMVSPECQALMQSSIKVG